MPLQLHHQWACQGALLPLKIKSCSDVEWKASQSSSLTTAMACTPPRATAFTFLSPSTWAGWSDPNPVQLVPPSAACGHVLLCFLRCLACSCSHTASEQALQHCRYVAFTHHQQVHILSMATALSVRRQQDLNSELQALSKPQQHSGITLGLQLEQDSCDNATTR